jgi:hypothetical protein
MYDWLTKWMRVHTSIEMESDPERQMILCNEARQALQERLVELCTADGVSPENSEQSEIEEALRRLWTTQQALLNSCPSLPKI